MDPGYWEELAGLDPSGVCRRARAAPEKDGYRLRIFNGDYLILPGRREIIGAGSASESVESGLSDALEMLAVYYLIHARDLPLAGQWVGLQELGGTNRFFVSHPPDFGRLLPLCSSLPETVEQAARSLGGRSLEYGDLAVELPVLPRVPLAFVYWAASEEFPADASVLFDRSVEQHLPLDVLAALMREAIGRLEAVASKEKGR